MNIRFTTFLKTRNVKSIYNPVVYTLHFLTYIILYGFYFVFNCKMRKGATVHGCYNDGENIIIIIFSIT